MLHKQQNETYVLIDGGVDVYPILHRLEVSLVEVLLIIEQLNLNSDIPWHHLGYSHITKLK